MLTHPTDGSDGIERGIHLRWSFNPKMGFPPEGFLLFRRESDPSKKKCIDFNKLPPATLKPPYLYSVKRAGKAVAVLSSNAGKKLKLGKYLEQKTAKIDKNIEVKFSTKVMRIELEVVTKKSKKFVVSAYDDDTVVYRNKFNPSSSGIQTYYIQTFMANRIVIESEKVELVRVCYWECSIKGKNPWEGPINGDCGFGLPGYTVTRGDLPKLELTASDTRSSKKGLEKLYRKYCDKVMAILICRLGDHCRFTGKALEGLKSILQDMSADGLRIPVGWGLINKIDETPVCPDDETPAPSVDLAAYDTLLMNSYDVDFAKILGLYFIDRDVADDRYYDYMVTAKWPERRLWRLKEEVTFEQSEVGHSHYFTFHIDDVLFSAGRTEVISHISTMARTTKALIFWDNVFTSGDAARIDIKVNSGCKEIQVFVEQDGAEATLEAFETLSQPALDQDTLTAREGVLSVHATNMNFVRLRGRGIKILRVHYDTEYLPYGWHDSVACGQKIHTPEKLWPPDPVKAKQVSGALTKHNEDCSTDTYRFRAGLNWDLTGDIEDGILSNGPICYHVKRHSPRGEVSLLTKDAPVFVSPEEEDYRALTAPDGRYGPDNISPEYTNRFYYHDAVQEKGRYGYSVASMDIFNRVSVFSSKANVDLFPPDPPPPDNVVAKYLDYSTYDEADDTFSDPMLMFDEKEWLRNSGKSGLVVRWQWTETLKAQAPEADGFNIYMEHGWLNLLRGLIVSVSNSSPIKTVLRVKLSKSLGANKLEHEKITCGGVTYSINGNTGGSTSDISIEKLANPPESGIAVTIALTKMTSDGGEAVDYSDKANWMASVGGTAIGSLSDEVYEVYLEEPDFPEPAFKTDAGEVEDEKTRYAQIGVSTHTPDGESAVSSPASIMAIYRTPPEVQTFEDSEGLSATKADYFGKSTFYLRWDKVSDSGVKYDVYRTMDQTLLMVDKSNRDAGIRDSSYYDGFLSGFETDAGIALSPEQIIAFKEDDPDYTAFNNNMLKALANIPDNISTFSKLNDEPIKQDGEAYQNRITDIPEPGDSAGAVDSTKLLYGDDTLDGLGNNKYFYRLRSMDENGNLSDFSMATFPVSTPESYVPTPTTITSINGGNKYIRVKWAVAPNAPIVGYLLYKTDDAKKAGDRRRMQRLEGAIDSDYLVEVPEELPDNFEYTDATVSPGTTYYYGLVSVSLDDEGAPIYSRMCDVKSARATDLSPPLPPPWVSASWNAAEDAVDMEWEVATAGSQYLIQRRSASSSASWTTISEWLQDDINTFSDETLSPDDDYNFRIKVRNSTGGINVSFISILVEQPDD